MHRVAIIEDELSLQKLLTNLVSTYLPDTDIVGYAQSVSEAVALIEGQRPDLVFLDIEIMEGNSFDVLNRVGWHGFEKIFVTGYDAYVLDALRVSAIDYVLKPISIDDLTSAFQRYLERGATRHRDDSIIVEGVHVMNRVRVDEINYISIEKGYCTFHLRDGNKMLSIKSIKYYDLTKWADTLVTVHRSYVANLTNIIKIDGNRSGEAIFASGVKIPIAARRKKVVEQLWKKIKS